MDTHTLLHVVAGLLILVGLLGTVLPVLPGLPVMFAGMLLGPFLGAVGGEMADGRTRRDALKVGAGTWVGIAVGAALKVALAFAMLGVFALALLVD